MDTIESKLLMVHEEFQAKIDIFLKETDQEKPKDGDSRLMFLAECIQAFDNDPHKAASQYNHAKSMADAASEDVRVKMLNAVGGNAYTHFPTNEEAEAYIEELVQSSLKVFSDILESEFYNIVRMHTNKRILEGTVQ